jgi:hypothetical protein
VKDSSLFADLETLIAKVSDSLIKCIVCGGNVEVSTSLPVTMIDRFVKREIDDPSGTLDPLTGDVVKIISYVPKYKQGDLCKACINDTSHFHVTLINHIPDKEHPYTGSNRGPWACVRRIEERNTQIIPLRPDHTALGMSEREPIGVPLKDQTLKSPLIKLGLLADIPTRRYVPKVECKDLESYTTWEEARLNIRNRKVMLNECQKCFMIHVRPTPPDFTKPRRRANVKVTGQQSPSTKGWGTRK